MLWISLANLLLLLIILLKLTKPPKVKAVTKAGYPELLLDTSAIIDGRVLEVASSGFLSFHLLIPEYVVTELHHLADSSDDLKRPRGRFGLELVTKLQALGDGSAEVTLDEATEVPEVDDKLVATAQKRDCAILTCDYGLNQVASVKGVKVLNVNELAHALRPHVLPGEKTRIKLVQRGSDRGQAVGYLDDGTMIVVDRADRLIGREVEVEVSRIMQTVAGRMLFAHLVNGHQTPKAGHQRSSTSANAPERSKRSNGSGSR